MTSNLITEDSVWHSVDEQVRHGAAVGGGRFSYPASIRAVAASTQALAVLIDDSFVQVNQPWVAQSASPSVVANVIGKGHPQFLPLDAPLTASTLLTTAAPHLGTGWRGDECLSVTVSPSIEEVVIVALTPSRPIDRRLVEHYQQLKSMRSLRLGWDGHSAEPPNEFCLNAIRDILGLMGKEELYPSKIVASAEGGAAVYFSRVHRYADIEVLNDGAVLAVTSEGAGEPAVWEVDRAAWSETFERIRAFLD